MPLASSYAKGFYSAFEKISAPRWMRYVQEAGMPGLAEISKARGVNAGMMQRSFERGGKDRGFARRLLFPQPRPEATVHELKHLYRKLPGIGTLAPYRNKTLPFPSNVGRLIGKEPGEIRVLHGTSPENIDRIIQNGLEPRTISDLRGLMPDAKPFAWASTDREVAKRYGDLLETTIPTSEISHVRNWDELMLPNVTTGWKKVGS